MPESKRLPVSPADEAALRDRQIDALLDEGLDKYFASRHEEAIHLWTRVLFLDRNHARARAYIERARTAVAEVQRRSDELLQASRDLLEQGETDAARQMLTEALKTSGDDVAAAALRARLDRVERWRHVPEAAGEAVAVEERPFWRRIPRGGLVAGIAAVILAVAVGVFVASDASPQGGREGLVAVAPPPSRLPVPASSEVALVRAQTSFARGRLSEALRELDRVAPESPERSAADSLKILIQQRLMASVPLR